MRPQYINLARLSKCIHLSPRLLRPISTPNTSTVMVTHTQTDVRLQAAAASDAVRIEAEKAAQAITGVLDATKAIDLNKVGESK
jgi:hypothetical protein